VSHDKPVKRSAQDDDFVGVLKKNIPSKLALMGLRPRTPQGVELRALLLYLRPGSSGML
jgi:hypothetical protein